MNSLISVKNAKLKEKQVKLLRTKGLHTEPQKQGNWLAKNLEFQNKGTPKKKMKTNLVFQTKRNYIFLCVEIWLLKLLTR